MATYKLNGGLKLNSAEDIKPHMEELKKMENVVEINLVGNTYGIEACKELAETVKHLDQLKVANLSDIFTGRLKEEIPTSLDAILTAFLECKQLHTIDLSDNAFGIATIDPLEKFLAKHTPLQHLILANNGFGPQAGSRIGVALEKLAAEKQQVEGGAPPLETVVCGRNRLENGSMEAWAKMLSAHGTVKELRIYQNGIRQEGIEHLLLNGLNKATSIEKADFQDNTFTVQGSTALAKVIPTWKNLKELQVSDCLLSAKGGEAVARALLEMDTLENLEHLKLQYNEIEQPGLDLLKQAIEKNMPNLKTLELNGNRFAEDHELVDAISKIFSERGVGELDELDDMEEDTDDEDEDDDQSDEEEADLKHADQAENENVAPEKSDSIIDKLTEKIKNL